MEDHNDMVVLEVVEGVVHQLFLEAAVVVGTQILVDDAYVVEEVEVDIHNNDEVNVEVMEGVVLVGVLPYYDAGTLLEEEEDEVDEDYDENYWILNVVLVVEGVWLLMRRSLSNTRQMSY